MHVRWRVAAAAVLAALSSAALQARSTLDRDVEGYAMASCLAAAGDPRLKDESDAWASVIVQRSRGGIAPFTALAAAVRAELARRGIDRMSIETPAGASDRPVPLLTCHDIIDAPAVAKALDTARARLRRDYGRR
jgi:hypothetical protein